MILNIVFTISSLLLSQFFHLLLLAHDFCAWNIKNLPKNVSKSVLTKRNAQTIQMKQVLTPSFSGWAKVDQQIKDSFVLPLAIFNGASCAIQYNREVFSSNQSAFFCFKLYFHYFFLHTNFVRINVLFDELLKKYFSTHCLHFIFKKNENLLSSRTTEKCRFQL